MTGAERAALVGRLVEEYRPVLAGGGGMAAVQRLMCERGVGAADAVRVTVELLGGGPRAFSEAQTAVLTSPGRRRELDFHNAFLDGLERAEGAEGTERAEGAAEGAAGADGGAAGGAGPGSAPGAGPGSAPGPGAG